MKLLCTPYSTYYKALRVHRVNRTVVHATNVVFVIHDGQRLGFVTILLPAFIDSNSVISNNTIKAIIIATIYIQKILIGSKPS